MRSLLLGTVLLGAASAQTLVIPASLAGADGASSTAYPFDVANGRMIYLYDSTHFTANGVTFPILINQIRWRANAATATWTGSAATNLQVDLSTSPLDYLNVSTTWNSNHGADRATVFNGPWSIANGSSTTGTPGPFSATVTFTTPFLYDPNLGDLAIDTTCLGLTVANTPTLDAISTAGTAKARRAYSVSNPPAATGTLTTGEIANVLEFTYTPAAGLNAAFTADVTSGSSPLAVNFTSQSFSSAPGGITSYAWDFDNDAVIDSNLPNPSHVYASCGTYTVSLTVTDGVHSPSTLTKASYISTDSITANFTDTLVAPLIVQFTDTSTPAATNWAWDFNGDNIADSNAQNPAWVFPNTSPVNVKLTASRLCGPPSVVTKVVVPAQQLTAGTTGSTILSAGATFYMDLQVLNPTGVSIPVLDVMGSAAGALTLDVYMKPGTYLGHELTAASWTKVATGTGTVANTTTLAAVTLAQPWYIPPGNYAVALRYLGVGPRYNTATSLVNFGNGDLSITTGASAATYTMPFVSTSAPITPRTWAGRIYYGTNNLTGLNGFGWMGPGCAGTLPVSKQTLLSPPQLGGVLSVQFDNLPQGIGAIAVGLSNTTSAFGPLPFDLGPLGPVGCTMHISPDAAVTIGTGPPATTAIWNFPIPPIAGLNGAVFFSQLAVLDAVNPLGIVVGDAAGWVLGG